MATLCKCGCGLPAPIAQRTQAKFNQRRGDQLPYRQGHHAPDLAPGYSVDPVTGCWHYLGSSTSNGYAERKKTGNRRVLAYRWFYEKRHGVVAPGLQLDHKCRNKRCVNPDHLEPVTPAENARRSRSTKLTPDQVHEIRARLLTGERQRQIARSFGVTQGTITNIKRGLTRAA